MTRPWPGNRSRPRFVVAPLVFLVPSGPAAVCAGGRRPAREPSALRASLGASPRSPARPRHRPPAPRQIPPAPSAPVGPGVLGWGWRVALKPGQAPPPPTGTAVDPSGALHTGGVWCADVCLCFVSKPGQAPPPPTGTAVDPSGALHTGGAWCADVWLARCPEARLWLSISNFARNSSMAHSNFEFIALELQRFWGVSKNDHDKLRAKCGWRWCRRRPWVPQPGPSPTGAAVRSCVWRYARGSGPFPPSVGVLQH